MLLGEAVMDLIETAVAEGFWRGVSACPLKTVHAEIKTKKAANLTKANSSSEYLTDG